MSLFDIQTSKYGISPGHKNLFLFSLLNYNMIELVQNHAFRDAEIARL
jgi:hypothetical protein